MRPVERRRGGHDRLRRRPASPSCLLASSHGACVPRTTPTTEARPRSTENTTSRSSSSREPSAVTARALSREGARGRVHTRRATKRAPFSGAFLGVFALAATSCPSRCLCHRLASRSAGDGFPCSRPAAKSKRDLLARSQQGRRLAIGAMIFRQTELATKAALSSPKTTRRNRRGRVGKTRAQLPRHGARPLEQSAKPIKLFGSPAQHVRVGTE